MTSPLPPLPPLGTAPLPTDPLAGGVASSPGTEQPDAGSTSFGELLGDKLGELAELQNDAAGQAQALATGQAADVTEVVMAVERASLSLQLAAQVRNKAVEAYQEILRMQV